MTLIKIDLRTLKKNPNAGETASLIHGRSDCTISFNTNSKNIPKILEKYNPYLIAMSGNLEEKIVRLRKLELVDS